MSSTSFSGWGIRTLAVGRGALQPDELPQRLGLAARQRADRRRLRPLRLPRARRRSCSRACSRASTYVDLQRLPELFCGFPRQHGTRPDPLSGRLRRRRPGRRRRRCTLLQSCLGLDFDPAGCRILFDRPVLPSFVDEIVLTNLRVGEERADIALRRSGEQVLVDVLERTGDVRVVTTS